MCADRLQDLSRHPKAASVQKLPFAGGIRRTRGREHCWALTCYWWCQPRGGRTDWVPSCTGLPHAMHLLFSLNRSNPYVELRPGWPSDHFLSYPTSARLSCCVCKLSKTGLALRSLNAWKEKTPSLTVRGLEDVGQLRSQLSVWVPAGFLCPMRILPPSAHNLVCLGGFHREKQKSNKAVILTRKLTSRCWE